MKEGLRQSMSWLHTWSGLLVGWLLFAIFLTGTTAYYRDEISLWMRPELHRQVPPVVPPAEVARRAVAALQARAPEAVRWFITLPDVREPVARVGWTEPSPPAAEGQPRRRGRFVSEWMDPATGELLQAPRATRGGDFFYRFHFDLHYMPALWARWIVGFAAMFMLVAIVSGVITHKRIFADFFTFRPGKGQRSWLDAHNATAVLALPYHLVITYTGLVTLMFMYMPWGHQAVYKDEQAFFAEVFPTALNHPPAGMPAPLADVGALAAQASAHWAGAAVSRIIIDHPNDANASVRVIRHGGPRLSSDQPSLQFGGVDGRLVAAIGEDPGGARQTRGVLYGLHVARFAGSLLRALFFLSALAGCAMVATGALLWAAKERQKHARSAARGGRVGFGVRLVDGLNIGAIAGLPLAVAAFFWANRLLPAALPDRAAAEIGVFFAAWGFTALAGLAMPSRRTWCIALWAGGALYLLLPVLNALTTDSHLGVTLRDGPLPVAAFDLTMLAFGLALAAAARVLGRSEASAHKRPAPAARAAGQAPDAQAVP